MKRSLKINEAMEFNARIIVGRDSRCELCRSDFISADSLTVYFINRNPKDRRPENTAVLCPRCEQIFRMANPDGITRDNGVFDFAINRGLYPPFSPDPKEA